MSQSTSPTICNEKQQRRQIAKSSKPSHWRRPGILIVNFVILIVNVTARKPAGSLILVWKSCLQKQKSISIRCHFWLKDKPLGSQNYSVSPDIQSFISDMIDNFVKFKND